ncbi:MAG TPA: hypothetical protein VLH84_01130 [Patescibacteria group bacterium]|nr:hypothetical protein [Patescibacteria group bacterium]
MGNRAAELLDRARGRDQELRRDPWRRRPLLGRPEDIQPGGLYDGLVTIAVNLGRLMAADGHPTVDVRRIMRDAPFDDNARRLSVGVTAAGYPIAQDYAPMVGPQIRWSTEIRRSASEPPAGVVVRRAQPARLEQLTVVPGKGLIRVFGILAGNLPDDQQIFPLGLPEPWRLHGGVIGMEDPREEPVATDDFVRHYGTYPTDGPVLDRHVVDLAVGVVNWADSHEIRDEYLTVPLSV